jgi:hypothetical protein
MLRGPLQSREVATAPGLGMAVAEALKSRRARREMFRRDHRVHTVGATGMRASRPSLLLFTALTMLALMFAQSGVTAQVAPYQGFGATTPGGEGGAVVRVTNLNDSGPGSLRDAVAAGHRMVVFDVAGDILLNDHLYVKGAFVTIDGLSAPPPGITLRNRGLIIRGNRGAHDVVVRGIRVRDSSIDGIQIAYGAYNVIIDHVSVTGSADGNIDITESSHDVTVSWSLVGGNGKNMLVKYNPSRVTLHHNLFVESLQRSPQIRIDDAGTSASETTADIRNNVIAGWGGGYGTIIWYGPWANLVNNFYSSADDAITLTAARAYVSGNQSAAGADLDSPSTELNPFSAPAVDTQDACTAAGLVLDAAGAHPRDDADGALVAGLTPGACGGAMPQPPAVSLPAPPPPLPTPSSNPDLVTLTGSAPPSVRANVSFEIKDTVGNRGGSAARPFRVGYFLSPDDSVNHPREARLLGDRIVRHSLAAGMSVSGSRTVRINRRGTFWLAICVDSRSSVAETNEANNCLVTGPITVR